MKSDNKKQLAALKRLVLSSLFGRKMDTLVLNAAHPTTALFTTIHYSTLALARPGTDEFMHRVEYKTLSPIDEISKYLDLKNLGDESYVINLKLLYSLLSASKFEKDAFIENVLYNRQMNMFYRIATKKVKGEFKEVVEHIASGVSTAVYSIANDNISTVVSWITHAPAHKQIVLKKDEMKPKMFFIDVMEELGFRIPVTHGSTVLSYEYFGKKKDPELNVLIGIDGPVARVVYRYEDEDVTINSVYPADVKYIRRN